MSESKPGARPARWRNRALALCGSCLLAACQPVRFEASTNIPEPLIVKIPVVAGLHIPEEFTNYVHKEERWGTDWEVTLGPAQTEGIKRLMNAMFERVVVLDSIMGATSVDPAIRGVLEPAVEQYSFVTPRDASAPFYAVSIKYRVDLYTADGKLVESWPFTGYGSVPDSGFGGEDPLRRATAAAMRDAGAKLAVEFREQAMVRGLLPAEPGTSSAMDDADAATGAGGSSGLEAAPTEEAPASGEEGGPAESERIDEQPAQPSNEPQASERDAPEEAAAPGSAESQGDLSQEPAGPPQEPGDESDDPEPGVQPEPRERR